MPLLLAKLAAGVAAAVAAWAAAQPVSLPARLPDRVLTVPILMYHRVAPLSAREPALTDALTVAPADFAQQMEWLRANGYHAVSQQQLFAALELGAGLPARPIVITFDDGYRDVLWNAAPALHRLHMPATAYVITGRISGPDPSFLTWGELRRLETLGFTIGSHTVHHLELPLLPREQALAELVDSRRALRAHLGRPAQWLSYPAGKVDPAVLALARRAGYVLAVTTQPGEMQSAAQPLLLHRDEVLSTTGVGGLAAMLGR